MMISQFAKIQHIESLGPHPMVTCHCGKRQPLRFMYKCYYCEEYLCEDCAPEHFGKTRERYEADKEGDNDGETHT